MHRFLLLLFCQIKFKTGFGKRALQNKSCFSAICSCVNSWQMQKEHWPHHSGFPEGVSFTAQPECWVGILGTYKKIHLQEDENGNPPRPHSGQPFLSRQSWFDQVTAPTLQSNPLPYLWHWNQRTSVSTALAHNARAATWHEAPLGCSPSPGHNFTHLPGTALHSCLPFASSSYGTMLLLLPTLFFIPHQLGPVQSNNGSEDNVWPRNFLLDSSPEAMTPCIHPPHTGTHCCLDWY